MRKMKKETNIITYKKTSNIIEDARTIINSARSSAVRSVDFCRVQMYRNLGKRIFEEEQQGKKRADYGTYLIKNLASTLKSEYGSGFGIRQLEQSRQFYRIYPIANALRSQLNWTQYRLLISNDKESILAVARKERIPENPTIGILLCTAKNDEMVKMTLPKDNKTILASKYELYLPSEEALKAEVEKLANAQEKFAELTDGEQK